MNTMGERFQGQILSSHLNCLATNAADEAVDRKTVNQEPVTNTRIIDGKVKPALVPKVFDVK